MRTDEGAERIKAPEARWGDDQGIRLAYRHVAPFLATRLDPRFGRDGKPP
jgi:hypothetical protein